MAGFSQLVAAIATAEGIDAERVNALGRAIRDEGLIRISGRGTSAAQMDEQDAANLLIAVNTADTAKTASVAVKKFRELQGDGGSNRFGDELEKLISAARRENLGDYITKLIGRGRGHTLGSLKLEFEKPVLGVTMIMTTGLGSAVGISFANQKKPRDKDHGDRMDRTIITERTIFAVADVLRE